MSGSYKVVKWDIPAHLAPEQQEDAPILNGVYQCRIVTQRTKKGKRLCVATTVTVRSLENLL